MQNNKVLAVIPARGGSKGLPGKNIKILGEKPLIAWTIEASLGCNFINKTIVSTDCDIISEISKKYGADVPFKRPASLATDTATTVDVINHTIKYVDEYYDVIIVLQPTSPFRTHTDIKTAYDLYCFDAPSSVVSVVKADKSPYWHFIREDNKILPVINLEGQFSRRQDLPVTYLLNGAIYIIGLKKFQRDKKLIFDDTLSIVMSKESSIDIDDNMDFKLAQLNLGVK